MRGQVIEGAKDAIVSNSPLGIAWRAISGINFSFGEKSFTPNENQSEVIGTVIRVGQELGADEAQIVTAIATCIVESKCRELDGGDRDSIGAFQQRPSQDWPDTANTETQARAFFQGSGTNPGLLDVWFQTNDHTRMGALAQEVQKSAYPERYAEWIEVAQQIYNSAISEAGDRTFPIPDETLDSVTITSGFGVRTVFGQSDEHNGVDIAAAAGTVIVSTSGGNVRDVTTIVDQQQVCISSEIGVECFIHLDDVAVEEGDRVVAGQKIGVIAATSAAAR